MLRVLCFGEEAGARNLVFFRVKWLQPAMKGTSFVRRVRLGSFLSRIVPPMCFATSGCSCVHSSMRFLNLWLQIALERLHKCCMPCVVGRKPEHETFFFPCKVVAAGDERYLVCAAGAAGVVSVAIDFFYVFCNELQFPRPLRVIFFCFATQSLQIASDACVNVAWYRGCMRNTIVFCS